MNIRIASLDPNAPRASRDCRICNRRRIKCDRSLPTCKKCGIRKLECTGYDQKLKWNQGIASRGKYAGRVAPTSQKSLARSRGYENANSECSETSPEATLGVASPTGSEVSLSEMPFETDDSTCDDKCVQPLELDEKYDIDLSLSWSQVPHIYRDPQVRRLISHYDHHVATTFVWIDTPENRWRNDVLPLAQESPSLLFAILALASTHLSSKLPASDPSAIQLSTRSLRYRDQSLQLLAQHLGGEALKRCSGKSISSILASMYILCSMEMVPGDSAVWQVHLLASYILIRHWLSTASVIDRLDNTSKYLVTQFSIINVFASTTSFGRIEKLSNIDLTEKESTMFGDYLEIIHAITVEERDRATLRELGCVLSTVDLTIYATKLECARNSTRRLSKRLCLATNKLKCEFERVINVYHHSGLMYAYQALAEPSDIAKYTPQLLRSLLDELIFISTKGPFAQDISWPLFISGTACRHLENEQRLLERLMLEEMECTGFSNCQQALKFLRAFWSEGVDGETWIEFARRYSKQGREFLAL